MEYAEYLILYALTVAVPSGGNLQKLILVREIDRFRDYFFSQSK